MRTVKMLSLLAGLILLLWPQASPAHWCSNIYQTYARIVVKPERDRLDVAVGERAQLQVRVRNNFPYTLHYIKLRAQASDALEVTVSPSERAAEQHPVVAGEEVTFVLQITRRSEGPDEIDVLGLEVNTTVEEVAPRWRDQTDTWVTPEPTEAQIREHQDLGLHQARALTWYKLTELGCPGCERDGVAGLVELWAARLDPCAPGGFDSPMAMQYIRAGHQLAVRLRFSDFVEADRDEVVGHMLAAMDDANPIARGFAAFLAAYGSDAAQITDRIRAMADSDPDGACTFEPDPRAQLMAKAALLLTGDDTHRPEVLACAGDEGEPAKVRATCAAALGVMGEDAPVVQTLLGLVPDGKNMSYDRMFASYLLQLVVFERRGGPTADAAVSFLDETPYPEPPDKGGCTTGGSSAAGGLALLLAFWMVLRASRARC